MAESLESVIEAVRDRVEPTAAERDRLERVAEQVTARAREAIADLPVSADVLRVGSTARDTWLADDRDIDVFVRFPSTISRDELERYGLAVGRQVLPDGREEFAEHPYVSGTVDGFDVDLVPCYRIETATEARTAVDRTPFHTAHVQSVLTPRLASDVRVAKQFLTGCGIYGSDLRTRGFSGYLTELLVIEYDGFVAFARAVADWRPPVRLDPADHGVRQFDAPLVVIDPTDPERNVAAVLTEGNVARLQHHARLLLAAPAASAFTADEPNPLSETAVRDHIDARGTTPIALTCPRPTVVEDQLYPQLEKSLSGICDALDRAGLEILRRAGFVDESGDRLVFFAELASPERPSVERHAGPPVHVRSHAERFYDQYKDDGDVYGPFIAGDRYVVERPREWTHVREWMTSTRLFDVAHGPDVADALRADRSAHVGSEVAALVDSPTVARALSAYFDPTPCHPDSSP